DAAGEDDAAERDDGDFRRAAADVDHHAADRFGDGEFRADRGGHRFFNEENAAGAGHHGAFADGAALDFRNACGDADDDSRAGDVAVAASAQHASNEVIQHFLGDVEVGDDAVLHGADRGDVARGAAKHALGFHTDGDDLVVAAFDGDNGGFAQDNALAFDIDEGIRGAQIDTDIKGENIDELLERDHGATSGSEIGTGAGGTRTQGLDGAENTRQPFPLQVT